MRRLRKSLGAAFAVFMGVSGGGLPGLLSAKAEANVANITFEYTGPRPGYRPDEFVNTTPPAEFCSGLVHCTRYNEHKYTFNFPASYSKTTFQLDPDLRNRYFFKLPDVTTLHLVNEHGDSFRAQFKPTHVGLRVRSSSGSLGVGYPNNGGCWGVASRYVTNNIAEYVGAIIDPSVGCWIAERDQSPGARNEHSTNVMGISYDLQLPSATSLKNGVYRAQLPWRVAFPGGGEFDTGNSARPISRWTLDFEVTVRHPLKIEFPAGSERAVLEPAGGWAGWSNRGAAPQRLYRYLPFRIWTTSAISVHARCEYTMGGRCGIRNRRDHQVPLTFALTLPPSMRHAGALVEDLPLPVGGGAALTIDTVEETRDRQGRLLFEVSQADVAQMLLHPGETYQGDVTLVVDAAL
ncbi:MULTISPECIES: hypothetical protein [Pseudomonas]|uniref:hypothetical protein n=1 Tax=Pseudomonas TaxID=286 RepID=UPI0011AB43F8|nr:MULTISPECIES: hypothetical protein [Pseudomonas]UVL22708.1 hypothetical protein LOY30_17880 [Pseudomonas donghuensis]WKY26657.1 hypothetical protein QYF67_17335 [Pseudomonas donghuensis]